MSRIRKLIDKLYKIKEEFNAFQRLQKQISKMPIAKDHNLFIVAEVEQDNDTDYKNIKSDIEKQLKAKFLGTATDTEYSKDGFVTDDDDYDDDETTNYNYFAFASKETPENIKKTLKSLDNKYRFYGMYLNGKQI